MNKNEDLTKEERIMKEIRRLNGIFKSIGDDTRKVVKSLIENAAFMTIALEDLQDWITWHGFTSEYKNGENQYGEKKSPEVEIHIAMTKNHSQVMKQLTDLLPKPAPGKAGEEDDGFDKEAGNK